MLATHFNQKPITVSQINCITTNVVKQTKCFHKQCGSKLHNLNLNHNLYAIACKHLLLLTSISMKPYVFLNLGTLLRYSATACKVATKQTYILGSNKSASFTTLKILRHVKATCNFHAWSLYAVNCKCWAFTCLIISRMVKLLYYHLRVSCWRHHRYATYTAQLFAQPPRCRLSFSQRLFRSQATRWWNAVPNYISTF